jgi:hypothetical protein
MQKRNSSHMLAMSKYHHSRYVYKSCCIVFTSHHRSLHRACKQWLLTQSRFIYWSFGIAMYCNSCAIYATCIQLHFGLTPRNLPSLTSSQFDDNAGNRFPLLDCAHGCTAILPSLPPTHERILQYLFLEVCDSCRPSCSPPLPNPIHCMRSYGLNLKSHFNNNLSGSCIDIVRV